MPPDGADKVQWPPRSPHEAFLSSPRGRERLRRLAERTSPSPSPSKNRATAMHGAARADGEPTDSEDDEETLQLQLQEIQARLKLKRLQKSKAKQDHADPENQPQPAAASASLSRASSRPLRARTPVQDAEPHGTARGGTGVQVPVSPIRRVKPEMPKSPGRVLLGIDKGLKGSDISLKRAPSLKKPATNHGDSTLKLGGYLQRSNSVSNKPEAGEAARPLSFSERLASMRSDDAEYRQKKLRIEQSRSKAFDIDQKEVDKLNAAAVEFPDIPLQPVEFSREQIVSSYGKSTGGLLHRSKSMTRLPSSSISSNRDSSISGEGSTASSATTNSRRSTRKEVIRPEDVPESDATSFEPYTSLTLSRRMIPHTTLTRVLQGKKIMLIPELLKSIKAPNFSLPEIEQDIVILAIIGQKSEPRAHKAGTNQRGKYLVMTLTDLSWWVELYLFGSAFENNWKVSTGTMIAILNPQILPPPPGRQDTNRFSLALSSDDEKILEIGRSQHLGHCKSIKKDNKPCDSWVDLRHSDYCEFHINETVRKTKSGRMEVNTMSSGRGGGNFGSRKFNSEIMSLGDGPKDSDHVKWNSESRSRVWLHKSSGADIFERMDADSEGFSRRSKAEILRQRAAEREKERDIMQKLGSMGTGLGANYMRQPKESTTSSAPASFEGSSQPRDAAALGLLDIPKKVSLSPVKRKRDGSTSTGSIGWGKNLKSELDRLKQGESLQPVKKKTRFLTDRGIKIAGRDSLGDAAAAKAALDDDDDDLEIVP